MTKTNEELLADALATIEDLKIRVHNLEKSIVVKAKPWSVEEDAFLSHLASNINLTQDQVRTRTTMFLRLVMAFQQTHGRTERAISMRLAYKYFGNK